MTDGRERWSFILVAAGSGNRMGGTPKQFRQLGPLPVWKWSARIAESLYEAGSIDELVVVFPAGYTPSDEDRAFRCPISFTAGGMTRTESVVCGMRAASGAFVLVHDAARPFLDQETCEALMTVTDAESGAIPLLASVDSLKKLENGKISVLPRETAFKTQTPQAFPRKALLEILLAAPGAATDEASLWLASARELRCVPGSERNFKLTGDFDWAVARSLVDETRVVRTGFGYDVHELIPGRRLVLGGMEIDSPLGLLGHSDADIVCHAVSDAILGAAGEGDIGTRFPASSAEFKDADSTKLLACVLDRVVVEQKWHIAWLDVTLVAQIPRLAEHLPKISNNLQKLFTNYGIRAKLNLKVKSGEFVGDVGRAESMICYAVATVERF